MIATITEPPKKRGSDLSRQVCDEDLVTLVLDSDLRGDVGGTVSVHLRGAFIDPCFLYIWAGQSAEPARK